MKQSEKSRSKSLLGALGSQGSLGTIVANEFTGSRDKSGNAVLTDDQTPIIRMLFGF